MALITLTGSQVFSGGVLIGFPTNNNSKLTDIISLYGVSRAFSIILDPDTGVLHVSGDNTYGQLGLQYANENEEAGITDPGTEDNPNYASWGLLDRDNNYFAGKAQKSGKAEMVRFSPATIQNFNFFSALKTLIP